MAKAIFLGNEVKNLSLTDPQAWADVLGWEVNKGDLTAPLAASAVGWVYRCIHIRAGAVASLPWAIYRGDEKIIDQDETSLALPWADDLGTMLYLTESALCIYGYAYWRKVINRGRSISELRWWSPETTTPVWDAALGLVAFDRRVNNRLARYPKEEIVYFRIPSAAHETEPGTSPVAAALDDAGILYNVNQFASSFFKRGAIKATLLTVEGDPLQSERERLKSWWRRAFEGIGNAWSTEVISAAVKPVIIGEGIAELGNTELTQERREGISTAMGVPHSLVMSNAANFATAQSDTQGFYDWTIRPQARILANVLNRQLFAPLGLQFRFNIESLSIYQEDEEQRSGALLNLVNAGVPLPLAMEILGVDLPGTLTYEELQSQLAPVEVAPIPAPALPPPPPPVEDGKAIDLKRFRSWAAKRKQPDPDDFKSDHLSRWEKAAILAELREDADGGTMSPFLPTDGTHTHKAALPLDPDNPEAELVARMEVEAEAERGIATALAKQQRAVVAAVQQENTVQAAEVALRDTRGTATDALRRALIASADLGVSVAVSQFENIGFGFDWTLSNTAARAWAERHVGTLIRQIDETTLKQVRQSVAAWVDNGEPLSALRRELAVTFGPQRAQRIAATEVTRAYAEGNLQAYRDSGVVSQIELRTAVDERVCPVCGPLDGKKTDANNPSFGGQGIPPFHVNCRCWIVPVVGAVQPRQPAPERVEAGTVAPTSNDVGMKVRSNLLSENAKVNQQKLLSLELDSINSEREQILQIQRSARTDLQKNKLRELEEKYQTTFERYATAPAGENLSIEQQRKLLAVDAPSRVSVDIVGELSDIERKRLKDSTDFIESISSNLDVKTKINQTNTGTQRAFYNEQTNTVVLQTYNRDISSLHELGHAIEKDSGEAFWEYRKKFYDSRTQGDELQRLYRGNDTELYKKDKWSDPYMGKVYSGTESASELISMGLEELYNNPLKFAESDPDFFDFVISYLRR